MSNVRRVYSEKMPDFAVKAKELKEEIGSYLNIDTVTNVRVLIRYDIENITDATHEKALVTVFSEPPVDFLYEEEFAHNEEDFVFGVEYYGAKNWLVIGPLSLQPSELSKVCFVFIGASSMDRLLQKKNLILFIGYSVTICGCLALMNDFGTALIFFCAFLVIAYMRSGSVGTVGLAITALGFAGVVALKIAPHALRRFATWRHIWEVPLDGGFQQTRALMCMASGGLLGLGPGKGYMKHVFAADSDMVVATLSEEWGLIVLVLMILSVATLGFFVVRSASLGRSSFYTIGACTAASVLLVQVILNALGTVDVVPLTGVTFPFVSNGGSSMIAAWGLLAFVKAADTRQNASFAVRLVKRGGVEDE